jgi:L,D-peptidoglycan transpeptidase YkuD (ErfK/YbiS/YcfS/YnhG family)
MQIRKRYYVTAVALLWVIAVIVISPLTSFGAEMKQKTEIGPGVPKFSEAEKALPEGLSLDENTDRLIAVIGTEGYCADVLCYERAEEGWQPVWKEQGYVGRSGISTEKKEGDGATPTGIYSFFLNFGLKEDPGSILPYHRITEGDFWVDDPESAYYNRLVNAGETEKDWNSAEDLITSSPYYNYGLCLDYNREAVPGAGSAIFLHCYMGGEDEATSGCISLPEERIRELLLSVTEHTKIAIMAELD